MAGFFLGGLVFGGLGYVLAPKVFFFCILEYSYSNSLYLETILEVACVKMLCELGHIVFE